MPAAKRARLWSRSSRPIARPASAMTSSPRREPAMNAVQPFIAVENLSMSFRRHGSFFGRLSGESVQLIRALNGVSFTVARGETLGIVGESGCGKSTLARCLVRLYRPDAGRVDFDGIDVLALKGALGRAYNRRVQMVFQDP